MANEPIPMDPKIIVDTLIRRRWVIILPFFLAMMAGIVLAVKLPKIYKASTLILIQAQKVPEQYVKSIVTTEPGERINTLSQQILSRTNLEKIIDEFNLYQGPGFEKLYVEDKIDNLRKNISVTVSNDQRRENDAFTISYQGKNPERVMRITNTLASFFIDENLRLRESQAIGTSDFLEDELQSMKKRLEEVEEQLKGYRETNMGELPEQLDSNLRILERLQTHIGESQQSLSDARIRLASLQNEIKMLRDQPTSVTLGQGQPEEPTTLNQMYAQLESLLSRYTERHPDVIRLKTRIQEMEKQAPPASGGNNAEKSGNMGFSPPTISPEYRAQRNEITQEIARLETDIADSTRQISIYQSRIENTPKREQELLSLRRDYENIKMTYSSLLSRKLESEIAVNMERKQKGEQFRVIDTAQLPQKPVKPDMKKLFIIVVGAGLAIGGGIIFLLEYLDNSFKRPQEIESQLNLPVLCTVPQIISKKAILWRKIENVCCVGTGVFSLVLLIGFAFLTLGGVDITLDIVKKAINI